MSNIDFHLDGKQRKKVVLMQIRLKKKKQDHFPPNKINTAIYYTNLCPNPTTSMASAAKVSTLTYENSHGTRAWL